MTENKVIVFHFKLYNHLPNLIYLVGICILTLSALMRDFKYIFDSMAPVTDADTLQHVC